MNNPENNPGFVGQDAAGGQVPPHQAGPYGNGQVPPYGYYPPPPYGPYAGMNPGYTQPGMPPYGPYAGPPPGAAQAPPSPEQAAARAGLTAALNDIADKSGLGMVKDLFNWEDGEFWKGAMVGAAVVLLLTNDNLRNSLISGAAKTAEAMKSGLSGLNGESDEELDAEADGDIDTQQEAE